MWLLLACPILTWLVELTPERCACIRSSHGEHRVVRVCIARDDGVDVIRILHQRMDQTRNFSWGVAEREARGCSVPGPGGVPIQCVAGSS